MAMNIANSHEEYFRDCRALKLEVNQENMSFKVSGTKEDFENWIEEMIIEIAPSNPRELTLKDFDRVIIDGKILGTVRPKLNLVNIKNLIMCNIKSVQQLHATKSKNIKNLYLSGSIDQSVYNTIKDFIDYSKISIALIQLEKFFLPEKYTINSLIIYGCNYTKKSGIKSTIEIDNLWIESCEFESKPIFSTKQWLYLYGLKSEDYLWFWDNAKISQPNIDAKAIIKNNNDAKIVVQMFKWAKILPLDIILKEEDGWLGLERSLVKENRFKETIKPFLVRQTFETNNLQWSEAFIQKFLLYYNKVTSNYQTSLSLPILWTLASLILYNIAFIPGKNNIRTFNPSDILDVWKDTITQLINGASKEFDFWSIIFTFFISSFLFMIKHAYNRLSKYPVLQGIAHP